jgi:hypothetical protein
MGRWIDANLPANAVVAVFDIGGIGYFSHRRIVDLGGLTDPAFVPHLYDRSVRRYLEDHRIVWLVLPIDPDKDETSRDGFIALLGLQDTDGFHKVRAAAFEGDSRTWMIGWTATGHAARSQVLYRVER